MSIKTFLESTKTELTHVTWPTTRQVIFSTITIIIVAALVGYFLGFLDSMLARGLEFILNK